MSRSPLALSALFLFAAALLADDPPKEPKSDTKALPEWVKQLESEDADARMKAAESIRGLTTHADLIVDALIEAAARNPRPLAQVRLLIELGPRAVPGLTAALWSADERTQRVALAALSRIGEDAHRAVPTIVRMLADQDAARRIQAVYTLQAINSPSAFPALSKLLADPDEGVRVRAASALVLTGGDSAPLLPVLIKLLDSTVEGVSQAAAQLLATLGPEAASAVPTLIARLPEGKPAEISGFVEALGRIGPAAKEAVRALKALLKDAKEDAGFLRHDVAIALWRIARDPAAVTILRDELAKWTPDGPPSPDVLWRIDQGPETVAVLEKLLKSENPEVAITAAGLLGTKSKEAVPLLGRMLSNKEAKVRGRAVVALVQLGSQAKEAAEAMRAARKDDVPYIGLWSAVGACRLDPTEAAVLAVAGFLEDRDPEIRRSAAEALSQLHGKSSPTAPRLTAARTDPDPQTRMLATFAWWNQTSDPAALTALADLLKDPNPEVREMAALQIGARVGAEAKPIVPDLVKRLFDPFARVRSTAAEAMGRTGPAARDAALVLLTVLDGDEPGFVQSAACEALGLIGPTDKEAVAAVLKKKLDHPDSLTRTHAAFALFVVAGDKAGDKIIEKGLGHRQYQVRVTAAEALWRMNKDERAVPLLVRAMEESNLDGRSSDNERYMAARALGRIGEAAKPAVPELVRLLGHQDVMLAATAAEALKAIDPAAAKAGVK